jgi:hypothetical protein
MVAGVCGRIDKDGFAAAMGASGTSHTLSLAISNWQILTHIVG